MKKPKKKIILKIAIALACVAALVGGAAFLLDPYRGTAGKLKQTLPVTQALTQAQAKEDLAYLAAQIKGKHLSAVNGLPGVIQKQYELEVASLPDQPKVLDVWMASSRILKLLNDAHSAASFYSTSKTRTRLDQHFLKTDAGIVCTTEPYAGWKVVTVNGVAIDELYKRFLAMFSYENVFWADYTFPNYLRTSEGLGWLGITTADALQIVFDNNGKTETATLPFKEPPATSADTPDFVRYEIDKARGVGILTLDECTVNQKYKDTVKQFFTDVKAAGIQNIAIDLRNNGGGNSGVVNEFLRYLPVDTYNDYGAKIRLGPFVVGGEPSTTKNSKIADSTFAGNVYVLTSHGSFSSAMWFAVILRDNKLCKIIGQAPGNKPSAYGDILLFQMPHSQLVFYLTYKQFTRPDASKNDEEAILPDYPTTVTAQSDGVLDKLYELVQAK
jgi:hypothetical protein